MRYKERLVEMIAELAKEEQALTVQQVQMGEQFIRSHQENLQRIHAIRDCLEAALLCDDGKHKVARQKVRAATASVDGWFELVRMDSRRRR